MQIALNGQMHHRTVLATRHDDRTLAHQGQHFFEHTGHILQRVPRLFQFVARAHALLAFAVIPHARCFQNTGQECV